MRFIGQPHIIKQLKSLLPELYEFPAVNTNILLRGPSGYGKTTMALQICDYLRTPYEVYLANSREFVFRKRVIFIDEVHKLKDFETLYPVMDSGKHTFIFATNQDGELPEAFSNRCVYEFIFDEYRDEELVLMAKESSSFRASDESFLRIVEAGNRNPRIIKALCTKIGIYFRRNPDIKSEEANFKEILYNVFSIDEGLDTLCKRYLEVLENLGGIASVSLLKNMLHVDEGTIKRSVEPILLKKKLIRISARGRSLIKNAIT